MKLVICLLAFGMMAGCSSKPKKPKIGECFQRISNDYGETIYKVTDWESGVYPKTINQKTDTVRVFTEYRPNLYKVVDCP